MGLAVSGQCQGTAAAAASAAAFLGSVAGWCCVGLALEGSARALLLRLLLLRQVMAGDGDDSRLLIMLSACVAAPMIGDASWCYSFQLAGRLFDFVAGSGMVAWFVGATEQRARSDYSGGCVRVGVQADVLQSALLDVCYAAAVPPGVLGALRLLLQQRLALFSACGVSDGYRLLGVLSLACMDSTRGCPFAVFLLLTGWVALA